MSDCLSTFKTCFTKAYVKQYGCLFNIPGECVYYSGNAIAGINIEDQDTLNTVIIKLVAYINQLAGITTTSTTTTTTTT